MTVSLIISTYNNPRFLGLCLDFVKAQTVMPCEVIVADDGSTAETAELITRYQRDFPTRLLHVWHEDLGFRAGQIRNKAVVAASGEYIVQIDGDILVHADFIKDHVRFAKRGSFVTGSRTLLSAEQTEKVLTERRIRFKQLRMPALTRIMQRFRSSRGGYARGCNMAYWRDDMIAVNGYSNYFVGWGREDSELSWRFINYGLKKRFIKFAALQYHMHHPINSRYNDDKNIELMEQTRRSGLVRCADGIAQLK